MILDEKIAQKAAEYLGDNDKNLLAVITSVGMCTIRPHANHYQELVDSIISQQLSVKAAASIEKKFCNLFGSDEFPSPTQILKKDVDTLRSAGLSRAKAIYVQDLALSVLEGRVKFDHFDELTNDEIINELTQVKGIGEWTAHMFLMFSLGRTDILPVGDLGIKNGIQKLYKLKKLPGKDEIESIALKNKWHPFESIASWYVWQSLDNTPAL